MPASQYIIHKEAIVLAHFGSIVHIYVCCIWPSGILVVQYSDNYNSWTFGGMLQCLGLSLGVVDGWGHSQNLLCSRSTSVDLSHHQSSHHCAKSWWACSGGQGLTEDGGWWAASVDTSWHSGGPTSPLHPWAHGGSPTHPATRSYHEVEHPSSRNTNIRPLVPHFLSIYKHVLSYTRSFLPPVYSHLLLLSAFLCLAL